MNLHEECLLKYLSNPTGISSALENLQSINIVLSEKIGKRKCACLSGKNKIYCK